jgi:hypothetical protein
MMKLSTESIPLKIRIVNQICNRPVYSDNLICNHAYGMGYQQ